MLSNIQAAIFDFKDRASLLTSRAIGGVSVYLEVKSCP